MTPVVLLRILAELPAPQQQVWQELTSSQSLNRLDGHQTPLSINTTRKILFFIIKTILGFPCYTLVGLILHRLDKMYTR